MRRILLVAVAVIVAALAIAPPWQVGAQEPVGVSVTGVGWWSSRPAALAQPDGGFEVAASPTGDAQSVAAIRLSIAGSVIDSLQIRLVESSSLGTELGVLKVCSTTDPWTAANPGSMDDAPAPSCDASASLTRTTEGVWLGDISVVAPSGGEVSIMIVPSYQPPIPIGPGMIVAISGGEFAATGSSTPTTEPSVDPDFGGPDSPTSDFFGPSVGGSFGVPDTPVTPSFGTVDPPTPTPADEQDSGDEDDFALDPIATAPEPAPPWLRLVFLVPLSAAFGVGAVRLRRTLEERALAGGAAGVHLGR